MVLSGEGAEGWGERPGDKAKSRGCRGRSLFQEAEEEEEAVVWLPG